MKSKSNTQNCQVESNMNMISQWESNKMLQSLVAMLKAHKCRFEDLSICPCSYNNNTLKILHS